MSINNFRSVSINKERELIVQVKTLEDFDGADAHLPVGTTVEIVVIDAALDGKRCHPTVSDLSSSDWHATAPPGHPFEDGDTVCAVGALFIPDEPLFQWGKTFTIGALDGPK